MARRGPFLIAAALSALMALAAMAQQATTGAPPVIDQDGDGVPQSRDCNDQDGSAGAASAWYADKDGDGFGNRNITQRSCTQPQGFVSDKTDCNDQSAAAKPGGTEVCDGLDNNCDYKVDGIDATDAKTWYADKDYDRFGNADVTARACRQPTGFVADNTDCNDSKSSMKPGGSEVCDGLDNDCDGSSDEDDAINAKTWYSDADGDGYGDAGSSKRSCSQPATFVAAAGDCDDVKGGINPKAVEVCDGIDNDCDGKTDENDASDAKTWYADKDGDGFGNKLAFTRACNQPSGYVADTTDCNDGSGAAKPGGEEMCDGIDNDCDAKVDEPDATDAKTWYADKDLDRYGNSGASTRACRQPTGFVADATDCDDARGGVKPSGIEVCDGIDNDCDGTVDENDATNAKTWYADADGDGFGDKDSTARACSAPAGFIAAAGDCDDGKGSVNPKGAEVCDGIDNDCDAKVDEPDASDAKTWYADKDGDRFGSKLSSTRSCNQPSGFVSDATDCNDAASNANPDAGEVCDGRDNDCDGTTDEPDASDAKTWYADKDLDRYGDSGSSKRACYAPSGHVANSDDCDDSKGSIKPGGTELCDGVDNDCDGSLDEPDAANAKTWYADSDGDSFGDRGSSTRACTAPTGYVADTRDCDDGKGSVNPNAGEVCDGADNDCDGKTDEPDASDAKTWFSDADADGYGDANATTRACSQPRGYVSDSSDCNARTAAVNPGADERCDGLDNDCDGTTDEDNAVDAKTWYADRDGDRFGDERNSSRACKVPQGHVADSRDCDDSSDKAFPGGREVCDDLDNDCDGTTDEPDAFGAPTWYADTDGDEHGDRANTTVACDAPRGFVSDASDCNDRDGQTYPGAAEFCDGKDNNCNAGDESGLVTFSPARGALEDLSPTFQKGRPGQPVAYRVTRPGILTFCDGTFYANLDLKGTGITVRGLNGRDQTRLDGGGVGTVVSADGGVTVTGLTLTNGKNGDSGGGVLVNGGDVSVTDSRVTGNEATSFGGGLYAQRGTLRVSRTEITANKAHSGGGLYGYYAAMVLNECSVSDNQAVDGAGVYARFSTVDLAGGRVATNMASSQGGGVQLYGGAALTCRSGGTVAGNSATRGAAVHAAEKSELRSEGCSVGTAQEDIYLDGAGAFHPTGTAFTCKVSDGCKGN